MTQIEVVKEKVFSIGEQLDEVILLLHGKSEHLSENEKLLGTMLEDMGVSARALNVCHGNGMYTIGDITRVNEAYMRSLRNLKPTVSILECTNRYEGKNRKPQPEPDSRVWDRVKCRNGFESMAG